MKLARDLLSGLFLALALLCAGCIAPMTQRMELAPERVAAESRKQRTVAMQSLFFDEIRLNRVSYPLLQAALPYTGKPARPFLGLYFANKFSFSKSYRATAEELFGVDEELTVLDVIPGSPAEMSGLLPGDRLKSLNGTAFPAGPSASGVIGDFFDRHLIPGVPVVVTVNRDGTLVDLKVTPAGIADYNVVLSSKQSVNARATGNRIIIHRGLLRFAQTDHELALVIAHEIAHNVMGHVRAVLANYALGTLADVAATSVGLITGNSIGAAAALSHVKGFESEADYVGLYIVALAGMPIDHAPEFWRRMATIYPGNIRHRLLATHPTSPERSIALEETIEEIHQKISNGEPLIPEFRLPKNRR